MTGFENRVRFNWGYHDAAQAVREGWANPEHNFGFARQGVMASLTCVADVLAKHFDSDYAQGWQQGLFDAQDGTYEANGKSSEMAWRLMIKAGLVTA